MDFTAEQLFGFSRADLYKMSEEELDAMSRTDEGCDAINRAYSQIEFEIERALYVCVDQVRQAIGSVNVDTVNGQKVMFDPDDINYLCGQVTDTRGYDMPRFLPCDEQDISFGRALRDKKSGTVDISVSLINLLIPTYFQTDEDSAAMIRDAVCVLVSNGINSRLIERIKDGDMKAVTTQKMLLRNLDALGIYPNALN